MARILTDVAKNAFAAFPPTRLAYGRRRARRGYNPAASEASYPLKVFAEHRRDIETYRPISGRVLEIGPGGNIAVAALFIKAGASEATCIDVDPWMREDDSLYETLDITSDEIAHVRYLWPVAIESTDFAAEEFEIIYSNAALEHFEDPAAAIRNIARMLTRGGVTSHAVDFRDHRDFGRPLDFLKYGERSWRLATSHRLLQTNRWRASDVVQAFEREGLRVVMVTPVDTVSVTAELARTFASRFRHKTLDDLGVLTFRIVAIRD